MGTEAFPQRAEVVRQDDYVNRRGGRGELKSCLSWRWHKVRGDMTDVWKKKRPELWGKRSLYQSFFWNHQVFSYLAWFTTEILFYNPHCYGLWFHPIRSCVSRYLQEERRSAVRVPPVSISAHLQWSQLSLSWSRVLKPLPWVARLLCLPAVPLWPLRYNLSERRWSKWRFTWTVCV